MDAVNIITCLKYPLIKLRYNNSFQNYYNAVVRSGSFQNSFKSQVKFPHLVVLLCFCYFLIQHYSKIQLSMPFPQCTVTIPTSIQQHYYYLCLSGSRGPSRPEGVPLHTFTKRARDVCRYVKPDVTQHQLRFICISRVCIISALTGH